MTRSIRIDESGELTIINGPGAGKPVMCCHVARLCYTHCAGFSTDASNPNRCGDQEVYCDAHGVGRLIIGHLEPVTP